MKIEVKTVFPILFETLGLIEPLLQLPTGSVKLHTFFNLTNIEVWKGPYREKDRHGDIVAQQIKEDLRGQFTLELKCKDNSVILPPIREHTEWVQISKMCKDFRPVPLFSVLMHKAICPYKST